MMLDRESLQKIMVGFDLETLDNSKDIIYALSKDLKIIYYNPAWSEFAISNGADSKKIKNYILTTPISKAIPAIFRKLYISKFEESLQTGKVWKFDYECSSEDTYRTFNQISYPFKNGEGILVINRIRVEIPMSKTQRVSKKALESMYMFDTGFINQCSNCRCIQNNTVEEVWDWVPDWVKEIHPKTSHTICPVCYDYYWKYHKIKFSTAEVY